MLYLNVTPGLLDPRPQFDDIIGRPVAFAAITGDNGPNMLTGTPGADTIDGLQGDDVIDGDGGDDDIAGDEGADTIDGGEGADRLYSGHRSPGFNLPYYGNPFTPPQLDTGSEVDTLRGGNGDDRLFAGYGDTVDGGANSVTGDYLYISFQGASAGVHVEFALPSQTIGGGTITGIENISWVQGSDYDDYIDVNSNANGYSEFTAVFGEGGNDYLVAGYYTGVLYGGAGNDYLDGTGSQYLQRLDGGDGDDQLFTNVNTFASAWGGDGNDVIFSHAETHGGAGDDVIHIQYSYYGSSVFGDDGDDIIFTSTNGITVYGGAGNDIIRGDDGIASLTLYGGGDNDTILSGKGDDIVDGGAGNDGLAGGLGADTVRGGDGDDQIVIGLPNELVAGESADGGAGFDTLYLYHYGSNLQLPQVDITGLAITGIEKLQTDGRITNVVLTAAQFSGFSSLFGANFVIADAGTFVMAGKTLFASFALSSQGPNSFDLTGAIMGGDSSGGTQDYFVFGGGAADTITGSGLRDMFAAGDGNDVLYGMAGRDYLGGEGGNDRIYGGADNDILLGGDGDDTIDGGTGADDMYGDAGADSFWVDNAGDRVFEIANGPLQTDTVTAYVSYALAAGQEIERLRAWVGTDAINLTGNEYGQKVTGNDGVNTLRGGGGNDNLIGGGGADTLIGGTGLDKLTGGAGADQFVFQIGGQMDRVLDFESGTDTIDITAFGKTWQQVLDATTEAGGLTTIDLGNGDSIQFVGVAKAALQQSDFLLGGGVPGTWDPEAAYTADEVHAAMWTKAHLAAHDAFAWHAL